MSPTVAVCPGRPLWTVLLSVSRRVAVGDGVVVVVVMVVVVVVVSPTVAVCPVRLPWTVLLSVSRRVAVGDGVTVVVVGGGGGGGGEAHCGCLPGQDPLDFAPVGESSCSW